jgi:hypothetical protein
MDKQTARVCTIAGVVALALPAGCGVTQQTKDSVARSETAVVQAQQALGNSESGAMELQSARDRLDQAKKAVKDGDDEAAVRSAEEATLTAQLATAKNRSAAARKVADDTRAGIETLRQEAQRPADPIH